MLLTPFSFCQSLEEQLFQIFEENELMGLSVAIKTDQQLLDFHFGQRDYSRDLAVTSQTRFRIASISKTFTALGLMRLHDLGLFELDEDVSGYLGFQVRNPNFPQQPITFRMLLSHQSSLQDGSGYPDFLNATYQESPVPTIDELLLPSGAYYTENLWRSESPGSFFAYSNLNFGLIGALIEALSGQRFDVYMKTQILEPLQIGGSYNVLDLDDIDQVAVLYRFNEKWEAQFDHYKGVYPPPRDLQDYQPGTNGLIFAPQGGLRASALEVNRMLHLFSAGDATSIGISSQTLEEITSAQWSYNGKNGDNYFGLFNKWGLGLHLANNSEDDAICQSISWGPFLGHPGEAYGLVSDAYFDPEQGTGLVLIINGKQSGYQSGENSSFYQIEEVIFETVCSYWDDLLSVQTSAVNELSISPNPASDRILLHNPGTSVYSLHIKDIHGRISLSSWEINPGNRHIELPDLSAGLYFVEIVGNNDKKVIKLLIQQ
ncbi:hypothetical protein BST85_07205 [Aureitalea marina]|uniref:Beta-lactamase-related domain-containing protein n=1 Tax=Aureitalea marina TaxID=930804 RepID=A0A2S7KQ53_9FLAO|nr:hypothetical protein BST85_07205 [Aureitalea marina]